MTMENPIGNREEEITEKREATMKEAESEALKETLAKKWYMDLPFPVALAFDKFLGEKKLVSAMDVMHEDANRENQLRDWEKELSEKGLTIEDMREEFEKNSRK